MGGFDGGGRKKLSGSVCRYGYVDGGETATAERLSANPIHGCEQWYVCKMMCVFLCFGRKRKREWCPLIKKESVCVLVCGVGR